MEKLNRGIYSMKVYVSGKWVDEAEASISVFDHGLLYGDGVFEGIRIYNKRIFLLEEHIDRLFDSAQAIALEIPLTREEMIDAVVKSCEINKLSDGYIRLVITRGKGTLGLNPYHCKKAEVIIITAEIQLYPKELYEKGLNVITAGTVRNHPEAVNPRIKSLNYLNNVLAKIEAINAGCLECIMLNYKGEVAEASGDNIFIVKGNTLYTPPSCCGALEGITRNKVIEIASSAGYEVKESPMARYDLYTADEFFLTGTAAEIISVVEMDKRQIGNGKPGKITKELAQLYIEETQRSGTKVEF